MKLLKVLAIFSATWTVAHSLKILGVLPFGSNSHFAIGHSIVESLLKAGHEVTVISPYPQKMPVVNYTDIDMSSLLEDFKRGEKREIICCTTYKA